MLKILWLSLLISFTSPALAIYKCESNGKITYSDEACRGGKILELNDPGKTPASDLSNAQQQIAREKDELKRLENQRHKRDAKEEKEQQKIGRINAARQKKCASLALRSKWSSEDAAAASGRSADKTRRNARRATERYAAECGK